MFRVFDVSASVADRPETLGSKEKLWLTPQAGLDLSTDLHLFKIGRAGTGENWSEKAACEIAKAFRLPCADYDLAVCKGVQGVLSPRFSPSGLIPGNTLFSTIDRQYVGSVRFKQVRYKLLSALGIIRSFHLESVLVGDTSLTALDCFIGYLVFDALIGNTDRHHENWGLMVLREGDHPKLHLAPSFDHASSLGRELSDVDRRKRLTTRDGRANVEAYAERARSAFYGSRPAIKTLTSREVVSTLFQASPDATRWWAQRVAALEPNAFARILDNIPDDFITTPARQFAVRLLAYNQQMIRGIADA